NILRMLRDRIILEIVVRIVDVSDFSNDRLVSVHGAYKGTTIAFWQLTLPLESFGPDVHLLGSAGRMRANSGSHVSSYAAIRRPNVRPTVERSSPKAVKNLQLFGPP